MLSAFFFIYKDFTLELHLKDSGSVSEIFGFLFSTCRKYKKVIFESLDGKKSIISYFQL